MISKKNAKKHDGLHVPTKMHSKHEANLQKNNGLTFAIAMVLTLLAVYFVIEVEIPKQQLALNEPEVLDQELTYTLSDYQVFEETKVEEIVKRQKKVVKNIEKLIIDENKSSKTETDLGIEPKTTDKSFDAGNVVVINEPEEDFTFETVEQIPIFEECLDMPKSEQRKCFEAGMKNHVRKTFKYPEPAVDLGQSGRVYTTFTIDKNGNITDVRLRGPHKILEKEAARIISKLPKMIPGKKGIHNVNVTFSMPITFKLQ